MTNKIVSQMTLSLGNDTTIEIPIGGGTGGVASATGGSELTIKSIDEAGESQERSYILPVEEAEELSIFEGGEEGSTESLVLSNGKAIGDYSIAAGMDEDGSVAIAGCKGFFYTIVDIPNNRIWLSLSQGGIYEWNSEAQSLLEQWQGKKINIVGSHKHTMCITVSGVAGSYIDVDGIPFGTQIPFAEAGTTYQATDWSTLTNPDWDDGAIYCPELPEAGMIKFGRGAKSIGANSKASGTYSVAEGKQTLAANDFGHAEGRWTKAGYASHAEGYTTSAIGQGAHSEGHNTEASAHSSHAEGNSSKANGPAAHAEGVSTNATGEGSHAEGINTLAKGNYAHAEGLRNDGSEGAAGVASHVEGANGVARGNYSHVEGLVCKTGAGASGAHAEGEATEANAQYSHAEGWHTVTNEKCGHVQGKYNKSTSGYAHVVGNGEANKPSDAHKLDWNGNAWFAGDITIGNNDKKVATEEYVENTVENKIAELVDSAPGTLNTLNELAAALGNNENFATTIATELSDKATKDELTSGLASKATKDELTSGLASKAPAGYVTSTGTIIREGETFTNESTFNAYVVNQFKSMELGTSTTISIFLNWDSYEEVPAGLYTAYFVRRIHDGGECRLECTSVSEYDNYNNYFVQLRKCFMMGSFGVLVYPNEWEWTNPPMKPGVEYKTTERWNWKPVYVKRITVNSIKATSGKDMGIPWISNDQGAIPISLTGLLKHGNQYRPIPVHGYSDSGAPILTCDIETDDYSDGQHHIYLKLLHDSFDYANSSAEFVVKYIKE